jgi:hypothetical protein
VGATVSCEEFVDHVCPHKVCVPDRLSPLGGRLWLVAGGGFMDELGWCDPASFESPALVTPAAVLTALRRIPLPAAELAIQPPGHRAPVNFDVIFSTEAGTLTPTVTLLGQKVHLTITPTTYTWVPGDGSDAFATDWEGQPYQRGDLDMNHYVSHPYQRAGEFEPRVDVTYSAKFSVGSPNNFQPVPGTVTVEGAATGLTIVEAAGVLN